MDHDGGESINKFGVLQTQRYRESFNVVSLAFAGFDYNRTFLFLSKTAANTESLILAPYIQACPLLGMNQTRQGVHG